jgi:flavin-dependent dehydrogenase
MIRFGLTGARPYSGKAVVAVGEAVGATFPLTGEGIGKSMETAEIASDLVAEALRSGEAGPLAGYGPLLERRLRPKYRGYEAAQRWIARPWLADLIFLRASRSARVRAALEGMLEERVDPSALFSPRGVARALLG